MVVSLFGNAIGNALGEDLCNDDDTISVHFRPGILLDLGISWVKFVRKILIGGVMIGSNMRAHSTKCDQVCRASELPIYINEEGTKELSDICPPSSGSVEGAFGGIRKQIWAIYDRIAEYQREIEDCMQKTAASGSSMYKYLSEECDETTRIGAVGAGALTGFILGLRGGIIRRIFYAGIGTYGMSAICYPQESAQFTQSAISHSRKYATIAYNFIYGGIEEEPPQKKVFSVPEPSKIIEESHDSVSQSCHCPIGACLGRHDEQETFTQ